MRARLGDGNYRRVPSVDDGHDWRAEIVEDVMSAPIPRASRRRARERTAQMEEFAAGGRYYRRRARIS